jgi:hypothetical protein
MKEILYLKMNCTPNNDTKINSNVKLTMKPNQQKTLMYRTNSISKEKKTIIKFTKKIK